MLKPNKFIGDKRFYAAVIAVVLPIIIQNSITNFVSFLDNIMVGRIGTEQMSGVSIANQLIFVFNLCIFGGLSGPGIFGAQFYGQKNLKGVQYTFRFKLWVVLIVSVIGITVFSIFGPQLLSLYMNDTGDGTDVLLTFESAKRYLSIIIWGLVPFGLAQSYATTLRETGETLLPMRASIAAVLTNLVFNYLLIFGKLGFPEMGAAGAATATVLSRYVELAFITIGAHTRTYKFEFLKGIYKSMRIPLDLVKRITIKGIPLLLNEGLWSMGMALLTQSYSLRGLIVVAAFNIESTIFNIFAVVFMSMGNAVSILVGQALGAGDPEEAKTTDYRLFTLTIGSCFIFGTLLFIAARYIPYIYNTTDAVRELSTTLIRICACCMPLYAFAHCAYFTLRSGGKTIITFLFDSGYTWVVSVPIAFILTRYTDWPIVPIFLCVELANIIKDIFGFILVKKGIWIRNIVEDLGTDEPEEITQ